MTDALQLLVGRCGHCDLTVRFTHPEDGEPSRCFNQTIPVDEEESEFLTHYFIVGICPDCRKATVAYRIVGYSVIRGSHTSSETLHEEIIYPPRSVRRPLPEFVPADLRARYSEAARIEYQSPNGAAFLAGRMLEQVLRSRLNATGRVPLKKLIGMFLEEAGTPAELHPLLDNVRGFRNIAGHAAVGINGEWIDVEQVEASYTLDVVSELVSFLYVRPAMHRTMAQRLAAKNKGVSPPSDRPVDVLIAPFVATRRPDRPRASGPFESDGEVAF